MHIRNLLHELALIAGLACAGCTVPASEPHDDAGADGAADLCIADRTACDGTTFYRCGSDGRSRLDEVECEDACDPSAGCVACVPGTHRCEDGVSERCGTDHRWVRLRDCREWGSACGEDGLCDDACAAPERERTYTGCDFQIVAMPGQGADVSAVVANVGDEPNEIEIRRGGVLESSVVLPPRAVSVIPVNVESAPAGSSIGSSSVARLRARSPVIVSQFQPYDAGISASADASLLTPRHALGRHHVVASYLPLSWVAQVIVDGTIEAPHDRGGYSGVVTIVAPHDQGATVEITPAAPIVADPSGRIVAARAGETVELVLAPGEAAHLRAALPPVCSEDREGWTPLPVWCFDRPDGSRRCQTGGACREPEYDLTGTIVRSDAPVAVLGGHEGAFVPFDRFAADRLEEQMPPVDTWGREHVSMGIGPDGGAGPNQLRVIAAHDETRVEIDPPQDGVGEVMLDAGEWIELEVSGAFRVVGSRPVLVAQYLWGQGTSDDPGPRRGDPSMWIVPPVEQYRSDYAVSLPEDYLTEANGAHFLVIARPRDTWTSIDGAGTAPALGTTVGGWDVGVVRADAGVHEVLGERPFSLVTIGMADYTSYATPAGRDLRPILE